MSKLNKSKKELLACLDEWIKYIKKHLGIDSHSFKAYQQIYQIIQKKPQVTEEWIIEKACEASRFYSVSCKTVEDSRNFIRSLVEEMPAKTATVSEEWTWEAQAYIAEYPSYHRLEEKLKEAGVEVVKK